MPYDGIETVIPLGLAGMRAHDNRLLYAPGELELADTVAFSDQHLRKAPGLERLDPFGLAGTPILDATVANAGGTKNIAVLTTLRSDGTSTPAFVSSVCAETFGGSTVSQYTITLTGSVAVGTRLVLRAATTISGPSIHTVIVTDSKSHVWEYHLHTMHGIGGTGYHTVAYIYSTHVVNAMSAGDTVTFTVIPPTVFLQGSFLLDGYSGIASSGAQDRNSGVAGVNPTVSLPAGGTLSSAPQLLVGVVETSGTATTTITPGAGWTASQFITATGRYALSAMHKVQAATNSILAVHHWHPGSEAVGAGTVTFSVGSTSVVGAGTAFLSAVQPGDTLRIGSEEQRVHTVASNTAITVMRPWLTNAIGAAYRIIAGGRIVAAAVDGKLYKSAHLGMALPTSFINIDATTLKTGLSVIQRPGRFVVGGKEGGTVPRKLFYLNGMDIIQLLQADGTATTDVVGVTDWAVPGQRPTNAVIHSNRMVAIGSAADPHRLYMTSPNDHGNFTLAGSLTKRVRSEIGERLWGAASFQGILWLWKYPVGIFYIDDSDLDPVNWVERTRSEALGCAATPHAVLVLDDDIMFLSASGSFHLLSAVDTMGGTRSSDVSYAIGISRWLRENVNFSRLDQVVSVWYSHKKLAVWSVPSRTSQTNDLTLYFDFGIVDQPPKFSFSRRDSATCFALYTDDEAVDSPTVPRDGVQRPIYGMSGMLYKMDIEPRTLGIGVAEGFSAAFTIPPMDMAHVRPAFRVLRKQWDFLELIFQPVPSGTLSVGVYVDGVLRETLTYDCSRLRHRQQLHVGDGHSISIVATGPSDPGDDFKVLAAVFSFRPTNEDASRGPI